MIIEFDKSFEKSLDKIKNKSLFPRIEKIILEFEKSKSLTIPLEVTAPARKQLHSAFNVRNEDPESSASRTPAFFYTPAKELRYRFAELKFFAASYEESSIP
jgi:hypothetical protein